MSDLATGWVSPWWSSVRMVDTIYSVASVEIVNPRDKLANVTVRFFTRQGDLQAKRQGAIEGKSVAVFFPELDKGDPGDGWLRITSDHPVAPWGQTPVKDSVGVINWLQMEFYTEAPSVPAPRPRP